MANAGFSPPGGFAATLPSRGGRAPPVSLAMHSIARQPFNTPAIASVNTRAPSTMSSSEVFSAQ